MITDRLGWAPSIRLRDGMEQTYRWIYDQMTAPDAVGVGAGAATA
jgi:hypothetical protein